MPVGVRRWLRGDGITKPFHYPPMEEGIRKELYALYADEIRALQAIMGHDLSHWKADAPGP